MFDLWFDTTKQSDSAKRRLGVKRFEVVLRHPGNRTTETLTVEALDRYQAMQQARAEYPSHVIVRLVQTAR